MSETHLVLIRIDSESGILKSVGADSLAGIMDAYEDAITGELMVPYEDATDADMETALEAFTASGRRAEMEETAFMLVRQLIQNVEADS